jgi:hypothetical protein
MPNNLDPEHHFVRHVSSSRLKRRDDGVGPVYGVFPDAFQMRTTERELSGSWLEFFPDPHQHRLEQSAAAIAKMLKVKRRDGFAVANVEKIHTACDQMGARVRVQHEPSKDNHNPAYATIRNLPRDNLALLQLLANDACIEVHVASDLLPDIV